MLPGEDFGRRHQGRLVAMRHGEQHGIHRHDGLAAADVPLQQAIHRVRPGHVAADLVDRLPLAGRQLKRKEPGDAGIDLGTDGQRRGGPLVLEAELADRQGQLQHQQLLVDEPPPRPLQAGMVAGLVNLR